MYKPAPPRPKKTNITRTRIGCLGCRERRVKCDEKEPTCGRCERLGGECKRSTAFKFRQVYQPGGAAAKPTSDRGNERRVTELQPPTGYQASETGTYPPAEATNDCVELVRWTGPVESEYVGLRIPQSLVPRANPADAVRFYSTAWDWKCLAPLASVLCTGDIFSLRSSPLFVDMMVAVSASHLSRTSPQRRLLMGSSIQELNVRPNPAHESVSQEFYGSVMTKVARWSEQDFGAHPVLGLTLITLFCLIESSMGSFQTFGLHYDGAINLLLSHATKALAQDGRAGDLLGPLVEIRMQMWWRRVYFGTPEFHRSRPKVSFDPAFEHLKGSESRRASILLILCEAHRVNNAAIIAHWDVHCDVDLNSLSREKSAENTERKIEAFDQLVRGERDRLDAWHERHAIPGGMEDTEATLPAITTPLEVHSLHMPSHGEAMDFAHYIASRVLQSPGPLDSLHSQSPEDMRLCYSEVEPWIHLLLRVVAGMDWRDCVRYNMYTIGITGVLLACLLRSHDPCIGLWCEEWLHGCLDGTSFEEGSFPLYQTIKIVRLINNERTQGRDVFGLFQTVEDGGGSGKFGSYQSQALSSLLLYGRCRTTGRLHSYHISI